MKGGSGRCGRQDLAIVKPHRLQNRSHRHFRVVPMPMSSLRVDWSGRAANGVLHHPALLPPSCPSVSVSDLSRLGAAAGCDSPSGKLRCFQSSISSIIHLSRSRILSTAYVPRISRKGGYEQWPSSQTRWAALTAEAGCLSPSHISMRRACAAGEVGVLYGALGGFTRKCP